MPIREEAFPFAGPLAVLGGILGAFGFYAWAGFFLFAALCVCAFFRDPRRRAPDDPSLLVSPADGRIVAVSVDGATTRISVFMSVFNVHVNRAPSAGSVTSTVYNPGKFMAAWSEKASLDNEQIRIAFETPRGAMDVVMIAGLIARRIVCWASPDARFQRGERIGLIRFGSRVDLYLPTARIEPIVKIGDRVKAGETAVAAWKDR